MTPWSSPLSSANSASLAHGEPVWLPEASMLANACRDLAHGVESLEAKTSETDQALSKTGHLLSEIGERLELAVTDLEPATPTAELSTDLLKYARALPEASTELWQSGASGKLEDLTRSLPQVSVALISLSQKVTVHTLGSIYESQKISCSSDPTS